MSLTTTTQQTTASRSTLHLLADYELHHSGDETTEEEPLPKTPALTENPRWWPTDHRRIPPHRPINRDLDRSLRPAGRSPVEAWFIFTMLGGVNVMAHAATIWGSTGGKVFDRVFRYPIVQEATFVPSILPASTSDEMVTAKKDMMISFEDLPDLYTFGGPVFPGGTLAVPGLEDMMDDPSLPRDLLDIGTDFNFEASLFRTDYLYPNNQLLPRRKQYMPNDEGTVNPSGITTPGLREKVNIMASIQAFKESPWLWTPQSDNHGAAEQRNLFLPSDSVLSPSNPSYDLPLLRQETSNLTRGKILTEVLGTCESTIHAHVISNFPSTELLTNLIHNFVASHLQQDLMWIHLASIEINKEIPLFVMSMVAAGAVVSPSPDIRKLGFAMQEAIREAHSHEFERDNRRTRDLRTLQSFLLALDIGLWSGDQRKMEISESFAMPLLTMVRRAGHYRFQRAAELCPQDADDGPTLDSKWRNWITHESFKRLALYVFYRDTRSSMSLLAPPLVSYAEVATSLPCHRSVWLAKTAKEWKQAYQSQIGEGRIQPPSIRSCMDDSTPIFEHQSVVDVETSLLLVNAAVWPLIWQFREMKSVSKFRTSRDLLHGSSTMNSRLHEVTQLLDHIQLSSSEWLGQMEPAAVWLLQEQCLMHLYASLEDVQVLAGREGEEEARRIFPTLTAWVDSTESRQALVHAGQVIRAARMYQRPLLRDAAVAVYHASLVFWVYSVLSRPQTTDSSAGGGGGSSSQGQPTAMPPAPPNSSILVRLDCESTVQVQRFVTFGKGIPCLGKQLETTAQADDNNSNSNSNGNDLVPRDVLLKDTAEIMAVITKLLRTPYEDEEGSCPPLVENLSKLIEALGKAAVRRKPQEGRPASSSYAQNHS
ncbi:hypothetical protein DV735_g75, partial [Chaetothyriales sp. CBS 134920]